MLHTDANEPVLYLEQVSYLSDGEPLEYSDVWVRGDKLRITTVLNRTPPGQAEPKLTHYPAPLERFS